MRRLAAVLLVMVLVFPLSSYVVSAEDGGDAVLIDFGNGSYRWYDNGGGSTFGEVLSSSVDPAVA
ncbi:MAG: hypothetical protein IJ856_06260, partial [Candidatus Methanomethylophilaceae archaeon]|nr:hypothetical protein [Candidatus Methanomethylophilaceae archaeon]